MDPDDCQNNSSTQTFINIYCLWNKMLRSTHNKKHICLVRSSPFYRRTSVIRRFVLVVNTDRWKQMSSSFCFSYHNRSSNAPTETPGSGFLAQSEGSVISFGSLTALNF